MTIFQTEDRWLSGEGICSYLGVSKDTIYKWIDKKEMPAQRVGRLWKFRKEEVNQWVRSDGLFENKPGERKTDNIREA